MTNEEVQEVIDRAEDKYDRLKDRVHDLYDENKVLKKEIERLNNIINKAIEVIDLVKPELWNISNKMTYRLLDIKNILEGVEKE